MCGDSECGGENACNRPHRTLSESEQMVLGRLSRRYLPAMSTFNHTGIQCLLGVQQLFRKRESRFLAFKNSLPWISKGPLGVSHLVYLIISPSCTSYHLA